MRFMPTGSRPLMGSSRIRISGLVEHGGDELGLLLHALRELVHLALAPGGEAQALEPRGQPARRLRPRHALDLGHEHELLLHDHARVEAALLRHVADAVARRLVRGPAEDLDRPRVGAEDVRTMRRVVVLPAPLGPRRPKMLPRGRQGQVGHRGVARERLGDARRCGWRSRSRGDTSRGVVARVSGDRLPQEYEATGRGFRGDMLPLP